MFSSVFKHYFCYAEWFFYTLTAGEFGPVLIQDVHLLEKLAHFNRERVPERVVHAKGAGAHGVFKVS